MSTDMGALPIRVALVAFGHNNDQHMRALELFDDSWRRLDVRDYLTRDPSAGGVGHTENGMSPATHIAVFSMPEFASSPSTNIVRSSKNANSGASTAAIAGCTGPTP